MSVMLVEQHDAALRFRKVRVEVVFVLSSPQSTRIVINTTPNVNTIKLKTP